MSSVREITDWGLADELAGERPALLLGLVSSLCPSHGFLLKVMGRLTTFYPDELEARFIDLVENPSLIGKLGIRNLPGLILYTRGVEWGRWEGAVDLAAVLSAVDELMASLRGPD